MKWWHKPRHRCKVFEPLPQGGIAGNQKKPASSCLQHAGDMPPLKKGCTWKAHPKVRWQVQNSVVFYQTNLIMFILKPSSKSILPRNPNPNSFYYIGLVFYSLFYLFSKTYLNNQLHSFGMWAFKYVYDVFFCSPWWAHLTRTPGDRSLATKKILHKTCFSMHRGPIATIWSKF